MNVGDYIRIDGYISKIGHMKTSSSGKTYAQWKQPNGLLASANIKLIEKSSPQIIDLIEKNDLITLTSEYCKDEVYRVVDILKGVIELDLFEDGTMLIGNDDIKTIVTHEQMKTMQYRVEE